MSRGPSTAVLLDLLCRRYPGRTREHLFADILCGQVFVAGERVRDPRRRVASTAEIVLAPPPFASRAGEKLEGALRHLGIDVRGLGMLDVGSAAGGFTDCLLRRGAAFVHAVDVGAGQMNTRLAADERVYLHERTNVMTLERLEPRPDAAVCDLSFRSLRGAAARILSLTCGDWLLALAKPQFELRDPPAGFRGVLRDPALQRAVLSELARDLEGEGLFLHAQVPSPLSGRQGNREVFFLLGYSAPLTDPGWSDRAGGR